VGPCAGGFGGTDASTKAFADKLSRKLHFSRAFALRAIEEYKRFVYLGKVSDVGVTPSKVIDQVWHEHLLFSRAYRQFCREVLRGDFDHNPERVPVKDETGIFQTQYVETLALYGKEFNSEPPADIWSVPKFESTATKEGVDYKPREKTGSRAASTYVSDEPPLYTFFSGGDSLSTQSRLPQELRWQGYIQWRRRIGFCESVAWENSTESLLWRRPRKGSHSGVAAGRIWTVSSPCRASG